MATLDNTITNGASATGATSTTAPSASKKPDAQAIQDRFLTLLVTQMRNQDPLNPLDNSQVTAQLTQISTVTGIENLNSTVQSLLGQISTMHTLQASMLKGREVLVPGDRIELGKEGGAQGYLMLESPADEVTITVRDAAGATLATLARGKLREGLQSFDWDGMTQSGARAVAGAYTFTIDAKSGDKAVTAEALARGRVEGILREDDNVLLNLGVLGQRAFTEVRQVM